MKIKQGRDDYSLPKDFFRAWDVMLDDHERGGALVALMIVTETEMVRLRREGQKTGPPRYVAFSVDGVHLWPVPDAAYSMVVRYEPQPKQF